MHSFGVTGLYVYFILVVELIIYVTSYVQRSNESCARRTELDNLWFGGYVHFCLNARQSMNSNLMGTDYYFAWERERYT